MGGANDEGISPSIKFVNNKDPVIHAEPLTTVHPSEFVKNIGDYDDAPFERAEITFIDRNIANKAQNQKVKVSLKADGKRKQTGESFGKEPLQKFPSAKELKDSVDCHWVVAHVTPPSWKQHLKALSLEKLYKIHDKAYMRQAVLDNMLNSRTHKLISTLLKARASCDAIREREVKKDKACAKLERMCNETLLILEENKWVNYEQTLSILCWNVKGLESKRERLKSFKTRLLHEIDGLRQDRTAVVAKVVPHVAIKLIRSDEMGLLVAWFVKAAMFRGRCIAFEEVAALKDPFDLEKMPGYRPSSEKEFDQASDDLATATYPFKAEATVDPYAPWKCCSRISHSLFVRSLFHKL
ncbi:hypothetical protein Tco_0092749 [Tanacetum coccineum]